MSKIKSTSMALPDPSFTPDDIKNLQLVNLTLTGYLPTYLTNKETLKYVLYSEPNWDIFIEKKVIAAGFDAYDTGSYDGFTLYWLIKFASL